MTDAKRTTIFLYPEDIAVIDALKRQHSVHGIQMNTSEAIRYALMTALPATNSRELDINARRHDQEIQS